MFHCQPVIIENRINVYDDVKQDADYLSSCKLYGMYVWWLVTMERKKYKCDNFCIAFLMKILRSVLILGPEK